MAAGVCAITGASGYVGSRMASHLVSAGWEVRAFCRTKPDIRHDRLTHVPFDLAIGPAPMALEDVDALVHGAYDFGPTRWGDIARVNVEGSRRLLVAARDAHVERIVLLSTVAAFPGARSMYGRAKLEIEQMAFDLGATIIRPGLVWGEQGAAMFGALQRTVERLPVVPLLAPAELELALVCEDDLALLLQRLLDAWPDGSGKLFVAASQQTLTFAQLLRLLALRAGKSRHLMPVPWIVVWLGLRFLEALGVTPPFRSDSLLSLVTADADPFARATARAERYGVNFRAYSPA
jgi:nucleoside-diphosphate-sugar epimerase